VKDTKHQLHIGINLNFSTLQLKYCTWNWGSNSRSKSWGCTSCTHCDTCTVEGGRRTECGKCIATFCWNTQNCWAEPTFRPHLISLAQKFSARVTVLRLCINYRVHFYLCCYSQMSAVYFRHLRLSAMMWRRVVWFKRKFATCFVRRQVKWGSKFRWHTGTLLPDRTESHHPRR